MSIFATRISVDDLVSALGDGSEMALIDAREQGAYSDSHLLFAVNVPRSRVELRSPRLIPRRDTRIVVVDTGGGEADDVARSLTTLGWTDVAVLDGGNDAWAAAGHELYSGVNVPSKLFGELVEHHYGTPHVKPAELRSWIDEGRKMVILDSRTHREYRRMSIPTGRSCPGGELVSRVFDLIDEDTTVVVNCAGRTRSILGAQSLRNAGLTNEVVALENGTMGWELAGLQLDHDAREVAPLPTAEGREIAAAAAADVRARFGVATIGREEAEQWLADARRTTYLLDVRTPDEYEAAHLLGSVSAPGGQLVQATDEYMATRNSRVIVVDDDGTRASTSASWLLQMGWEVAVLSDGLSGGTLAHGPERSEDLVDIPSVAMVDVGGVGDALIIDVASSTDHRRAHIPGSVWAVRGRLADCAGRNLDPDRVVITSPEGLLGALAHAEAAAAWPGADVAVLRGGTAAWRGAGLPVETGLDTDEPVDDVWALPYDPGDDKVAKDAMQGYLTWEVDLVDQYDRDPLVDFPLPTV
ncbi:MAG: rhodanese-related sulfurtransferase [Candidatus Poriferisodalaceae bacterium]